MKKKRQKLKMKQHTKNSTRNKLVKKLHFVVFAVAAADLNIKLMDFNFCVAHLPSSFHLFSSTFLPHPLPHSSFFYFFCLLGLPSYIINEQEKCEGAPTLPYLVTVCSCTACIVYRACIGKTHPQNITKKHNNNNNERNDPIHIIVYEIEI